MGCDRFSGCNQLFQQSMAEQNQLGVFPHRPQFNKQPLPVPRHQCVPKLLRRDQKSSVFIKQRERVSHRTTGLLNAISSYLGGLQLVQLFLGLWKGQPAKTVEKIVQVVARGNSLRVENELFVGLAVGQS